MLTNVGQIRRDDQACLFVCRRSRPKAARAIDYEIRGGSTTLRIRRALLFYGLRRLGLDVAADVRPAHEQHIVLVNRAEVEAARGRAGADVRFADYAIRHGNAGAPSPRAKSGLPDLAINGASPTGDDEGGDC